MKKTITVLMSTYNGEKYLEEQINSILCQKGVKVNLLVRDDGSNDRTVDILNQYSSNGLLEYIAGDNIGYGKSFLFLFQVVKDPTDYYAFADQDDIWNEHKLYEAIKCLETKHTERGKLYFSSMFVVNKNKDYIGFKTFKDIKITLGSVYVRQRAAGCTMVLDNILFQLAVKTRFDNYKYNVGYEWVYLLCLAIGGEIYYDYHSYIDFRRHGKNVTSIGNGIHLRIKNELKEFRERKYSKSELSKILLKVYSNEIPDDNRRLIQAIADYRSSFFRRIRLMFNSELDSNITVCNIKNKICILLGVF